MPGGSSQLLNMGSPGSTSRCHSQYRHHIVRPYVQAVAVALELTSITLPESIQNLLADELAKATKVQPRRP